jgi:hypothetical protein
MSETLDPAANANEGGRVRRRPCGVSRITFPRRDIRVRKRIIDGVGHGKLPVADRTCADAEAPTPTQPPRTAILAERNRRTRALDLCQRMELRFGLRGRDRLHVPKLTWDPDRSARLRRANDSFSDASPGPSLASKVVVREQNLPLPVTLHIRSGRIRVGSHRLAVSARGDGSCGRWEVLTEVGRGGWPFAGLHFGAIAAPRFSLRLSRRTLELSRGSKAFANGSRSSARPSDVE